MACEHNFVKSGYGNDLICTKCGHTAMQAQMAMPATEPIQQPVLQPILRETIEIPVCTGDKTVRVSVYRDEIGKKELQRSLGLDIAYNILQGGA